MMIDVINVGDIVVFVDVFIVDGFVNDWGIVKVGVDGVCSWVDIDVIGVGVWMMVFFVVMDGDMMCI